MILVVAAMEVEAVDFIKKLDLIEDKPFLTYKGIIDHKDITLVITGIGKTNAAGALAYALTQFEVNIVLNIGFVGGYKLSIYEPYLISKATYHDFDLSLFGYEKGQVPKMPTWYSSNFEKLEDVTYEAVPLYTGDYFSLTPCNDKAYASDMEGNALYQIAYRFKAPILSLKIVSDVIGSKDQLDTYKLSEDKLGSMLCEHAIKLISKIK